MTPAMLTPIAYRTRARASSRATSAVSIVVSGPRALYSHRTLMVEAGSVAAQMAPKTTATASAVCHDVKNDSTARLRPVTSRHAARPSNSSMMKTCRPYLTKISRCNSPPMRKPIRPSAKMLKGSRAVTISYGMIPRIGPRITPMPIKPMICGIRSL